MNETADSGAVALTPEWLEAQYRRHATTLLRLAVLLAHDRTAAEDIVHDAFMSLHRRRHAPRPGAELAYLRRTVVNLVLGRGRRAAAAARARRVPVADAPSAEATGLRNHEHRALTDAVRALPDRQRACVVLHYWAEMTDAGIASALGISAGAVKTHLHRARASLAGHLEELR